MAQYAPARKLVLIGPPNVGKSSLKQAFLDAVDPQQLIEKPLPPTKYIDTRQYTWVDITVSTWDCGGQNFEKWLTTEDMKIFSYVDALVYVTALSQSQEEMVLDRSYDDLCRMFAKVKSYGAQAPKFYFLLHKADLIPIPERKLAISQAKDVLNNALRSEEASKILSDTGLYTTSILDDSGPKVFRHILNGLTSTGAKFQNICETFLHQSTTPRTHAPTTVEAMILQLTTGYVVADAQIDEPSSPYKSVPSKLVELTPLTEIANRTLAYLSQQEPPSALVVLIAKNRYYVLAELEPRTLLLLLVNIISTESAFLDVQQILAHVEQIKAMLRQ